MEVQRGNEAGGMVFAKIKDGEKNEQHEGGKSDQGKES